MKSEPLASDIFSHTFTPRHSSKNVQRDLNPTTDLSKHANFESWQRQSSVNRRRRDSLALSDKESVCSISTTRSKKFKTRINSMKPLKGGGINKKTKTMDYTNYAYNEAVGRLKLMLASESYSPSKTASSSYLRNINDDSADNYSDNMSTIDRPVYADISKYLSPSQKNRLGATITTASYRPKKTLSGFSSASKENLAMPSSLYQPATQPITTALANPSTATIDYYSSVGASKPLHTTPPTDSVQAPVEIFNFIEKQEDYIEQLEKESKYCRNELTNLLGKVKDVINENEQLTDIARSELGNLGKGNGDKSTTSPSSDSDDVYGKSKAVANRNKKEVKSPRYAAAPNIVYEARISELEADLMQAQIDLKRVKTENEDLKKKLARSDPLAVVSVSNAGQNCEIHRKQIEMLQKDKSSLEENIRHLQKSLDEAKSQQYSQNSQKRYINDLVQMERSQAEMEVRHLRDELDRQHERVRELQMEMARRVAEERSNAERRYNNQVDQLGGDLSSQWEQVAKLQLDLERQKRIEGDMKRDLANRNSQIEELKMELRSNRSTFLADMAQVNAEKQSLEQEITALRLQLDRALRENKTEAARLNAEINSLRQRLDRADADLLHSKREVLRLNDEIASLEKELAYGEMKNEIRPTKKDLDKRISEMQEKHDLSLETNSQPAPADPQQKEFLNVEMRETYDNVGQMTVEIEEVKQEEMPKPLEKPTSAAPEKAENANVYTSRFDDENIWQNISRSIERLDLDWAKMPPLPKLTPTTSGFGQKARQNENKCHCSPSRFSLSNQKEYETGKKSSINPILGDFKRYGNPITATAYSKLHKNTQHHHTKHPTLLPQPLKPNSQDSGGGGAYHHQQHNCRHDYTLDMHPPMEAEISYSTMHGGHTQERERSQHFSGDKHQHTIPTTTTTTTTCDIPPHLHHSHTKVETTTSVKTEDHCNPRLSGHSPRRKCHNHHHRHHQHHSHSGHSRCHSHDRGIDGLKYEASKTEPLPWLQQHLVLRQTIKSCHKCQTTDHSHVTMETERSGRPATADGHQVQVTTCCHTKHVIQTCCNNAECLKGLMPASGKREEQNKAVNTEGLFKGEEKKEEKPKAKPFKVDVNVRLVPKTSTRTKETEKPEEDVKIPATSGSKEQQPPAAAEPTTTTTTTTPGTDDNELYLDFENSDTEATKL
ncbi:uncharacterized protein LOC101890090 isoform X1 [Musca domestica]|uniref:Uncharacterized protein LOC101890090 isoform X1 n=1 Tax=Musca domestica TaxID=7370 RepID=A0A9J7IGN8_MUSDO|nr:uncharacterized protein LOC101890090 isoform X1 [Musca domestica]XP_058979291.1 uncharacterized protein LOC101890090 isoform X1 [Musca domestica]